MNLRKHEVINDLIWEIPDVITLTMGQLNSIPHICPLCETKHSSRKTMWQQSLNDRSIL